MYTYTIVIWFCENRFIIAISHRRSRWSLFRARYIHWYYDPGYRAKYPSGATCLPANCSFSEQVL